MKQKYTLTIADMQINVVTEAPKEAIDRIVGILDRKVRDILLKSKRCSRNEAALLCALDFCADKMQIKESLDELEGEVEALRADLQAALDKADKADRASSDSDKEKIRLEAENKKLYALLEKAMSGSSVSEEELLAAKEPAQDTYAAESEIIPEEKAEEPAPAPATTSKKKNSRNRVGSMFDLLTFSDI